MKPFRVKLIIVVFIVLASASVYSTALYLKHFDFSQANSLDEWATMVLNGKVDYKLASYGGEGCIEAFSVKACSALYNRIGYSLEEYPLLTWKWRVEKFPDKSAATTPKEKDDYAARVYVIFPFLSFSSSKFIEYVWTDEDIPAGTFFDSPEGSNVKIFVVRSGSAQSGELVSETRNVYDDYIKAFGKPPARNAGAVAIMCDADSTKTQAESLFGDIIISKETV